MSVNLRGWYTVSICGDQVAVGTGPTVGLVVAAVVAATWATTNKIVVVTISLEVLVTETTVGTTTAAADG